MTTTVEAWTIPGAGPLTKKDFAVEFDHLQVGLGDSEPSSGIIGVSRSTKDRIIDSANNENSLIRVFKDGHNCQSFIASSVRYPYGHTGPVQVTGKTIHGELEYGVILPQNYPADNDPDYEYRAKNVLINGDAEGEESWVGDDFEDGPPAGDPWSPIFGDGWNDPHSYGVTSAWARNGTYSLRFNPAGSQFSGIKRTVSCRPSTIVTVVGWLNSPEPDDVGVQLMLGATVAEGGAKYGLEQYYLEDGLLVAEAGNAPKGTGMTADTTTWYSTTLRFLTGPNQRSFDLMFIKGPDGIATADDVLLDDISLAGEGLGTEPWDTWVGVTMLRQFSVVDEGDYAFQFQVTNYQATEYLQGILQRIRTGANQGRRFTFKTKVRKTTSGDRRVVALIKRGSGTWYPGSKVVTVNPAAGWVDIEVSAIIDEDRFSVQVRDAQTHDPGGSNGPVIYVGKSVAYWGLGEQPAGKIIQDQIQAVKDRGSLTWLKTDSFDESTDSNGVAWLELEEMVVWHGMTILQLLEVFKQKGFGWDVIWNEGAGQYELQVFVPYTMGGDLTSSGLKFHALNLHEADIDERDPGANTFYAEGETGVYAEGANALLQGGYGRRERWLDTESSLTEADLQRRIGKASVTAQAERFSLVADVGRWFVPAQTARVGSLVKVEMSGDVAERQERIARMSFSVTDGVESTRLIFGGDTTFYTDAPRRLPAPPGSGPSRVGGPSPTPRTWASIR